MKKYDNIQLFRVTACLGVFVTHLAPKMGITGQAAALANSGASGVYLFFLISGFLACTAREIQPGGGIRGVLIYYVKRLVRILPLYFAVILYNMALHILVLQDVPADPDGLYWLRYFFLTNAFLPAPDNFWGNLSATWTVSLFCVFYLLAPLLVRLMRGIRSAILVYSLTLFLRYLWTAAGLSDYMMIFYYLHYFVLGMLVWELAQKQETVWKKTGKLAVLFVVLWGILKLTRMQPDSFMLWSWGMAVVVLFTGGFSWRRTDAEHTGTGIRKRTAQIVALLDRYSYGIYLVHAVVIDGIVLLQGRIQLSGFAVLIIAVVLTAAGAYLARLLIERPMEKYSRRLVAALQDGQ